MPRRDGTCWPRSPTGCSNGTCSSSCWGPACLVTTSCSNGLARRHREKVWAYLGFSDDLAHQVEAGADVFLMPSLFEPCGLNQLYSLAHGTVPLVRATGGLADTVVPVNPRTVADGTATGFTFIQATPDALWQAIETALMVWEDRRVWDQLVRNGMRADWSWERSAREYERVYEEIVAARREIPGQSARIVGGTAVNRESNRPCIAGDRRDERTHTGSSALIRSTAISRLTETLLRFLDRRSASPGCEILTSSTGASCLQTTYCCWNPTSSRPLQEDFTLLVT